MSESITITFRTHPASSMRAGIGCPIPPVVTLAVDPSTLEQVDRDLIAGRLDSAGRVISIDEDGVSHSREIAAGRSYRDTNTCVLAATPRVEDLLAAIRAEDVQIANYADRQAAAQRAKTDADREMGLSQLTGDGHTQEVTRWVVLLDGDMIGERDNQPSTCGIHAVLAAAAYTYRRTYIYTDYGPPDVQAQCRERNGVLERETEARRLAARELAIGELQSTIRERHSWVAAHGSRRLQRLVAERIGYDATYRREREAYESAEYGAALATERPGWSLVLSSTEAVHDVSDRALALLDAARSMCPAATLARLGGKIVAIDTFRGRTIYWPRD